MNTEEELQVRREVRAAVFRTERLRAVGRLAEAREELEGELAAAQARLASLGLADAATVVLRWRAEDEGAFALATLLCELLAQRQQPASPSAPPHTEAPPTPALAFPPPTPDTPVLADLLDAMLAQERRPRPPPS